MEIKPGTVFSFSGIVYTVTERFTTHGRLTPNEWVAISKTGHTAMSFTEQDIIELKNA